MKTCSSLSRATTIAGIGFLLAATGMPLSASAMEPSSSQQSTPEGQSARVQEIDRNFAKKAKESGEGKKDAERWKKLSKGQKAKYAAVTDNPDLIPAMIKAFEGDDGPLKAIDPGFEVGSDVKTEWTPSKTGPADPTEAVTYSAALPNGTNSSTQANYLTLSGVKVITMRTIAKYWVSSAVATKLQACYSNYNNYVPLHALTNTQQTWGSRNHWSCQTNWQVTTSVSGGPVSSYPMEQGLTVTGAGVSNRWFYRYP